MKCDVAIIGAGIAGASLAAELAPHRSVVLLEAEDQPGYHSTGRSNALWHETYGGPRVQPLTTASKHDFETGGYFRKREAITIGRDEDVPEIESFAAGFAGADIDLKVLSRAELLQKCPQLGEQWAAGLLEANTFDIDVAGYHAACLVSARKSGAKLLTRQRIGKVERGANGWRLGDLEAETVINAAGAWASEVGELFGASSVTITPYRRTISQLRLQLPVDPDHPFLIDIRGSFYFRPEGADRVWLSPHDETATSACDAAPEELDVAIAVDRFQKAINWPIAAIERSWAGLRSFAPDRLPVYGFDPKAPGFFWCAGQGGFGIQTAPAAAKLCAALITGNAPDPSTTHINPRIYAPARFA